MDLDTNDEVDTSSVFVMTRSSPPGTIPIKMKVHFLPLIISFSVFSLLTINLVACKVEGRFSIGIPSISEASVGPYGNILSSVFYPICGFIFSLVGTTIISYISMFTFTSRIIVKICRALNLLISLLIIFVGVFNVKDSESVHYTFKYVLYSLIFLYIGLNTFSVMIGTPVVLTILRVVFLLGSFVGIFLMVTGSGFGNIDGHDLHSIGEYTCVGCFLLTLTTFCREVSQILVDIVVVHDN